MDEGRYVQLDDGEIAWIRKAVDERSVKEVARDLGIHKQTVANMAAGLPVQRLTARVFRQHLATVPVAL